MATDYSKKKNDELQDLLKARSLPHNGKKAEMIARLQQDDTEKASKAQPISDKPATAAEDEIDWEDDAAAASTTAGAAAIAAGGQTQPPNPTAVPNQAIATDPSTTNDLKVDPPAPDTTGTTEKTDASATKSAMPAQDFSSNIPSSTLDDEIAKRKARAARFGTTDSTDNADALKSLERAKKFGTAVASEDSQGVKGLDQALPERRLKRGRGDGERGGDRQGKRSRVRGEKESGGDKGSNVLSEKDRSAAEARKKRFA